MIQVGRYRVGEFNEEKMVVKKNCLTTQFIDGSEADPARGILVENVRILRWTSLLSSTIQERCFLVYLLCIGR